MTTPDGFLPAALRRLDRAVGGLIDPQAHTLNGVMHFTDSRYEQLKDSVFGQSNQRSGGTNRLPFWTDAFDLLNEIDIEVLDWHTAPSTNYEYWFGQPHPDDCRERIVRQLAAILAARWRPQDVSTIDDHAGRLEAWTRRIDALINEEHHSMHLTAPCPHCAIRTVQRYNGGELVRQAALQIDALGCHCLACGDRWAPEYFLHLARVIGCPAPAGILE